MRNWAKTVITWNLALDPPAARTTAAAAPARRRDGRPGHRRATPDADYYVLGHATFVRPGAARIGSTARAHHDVAFRNPDGSIA